MNFYENISGFPKITQSDGAKNVTQFLRKVGERSYDLAIPEYTTEPGRQVITGQHGSKKGVPIITCFVKLDGYFVTQSPASVSGAAIIPSAYVEGDSFTIDIMNYNSGLGVLTGKMKVVIYEKGGR